MDTGFYLGAMSYRYRCTGAPADLAVCRRTLGALKYIYDLGAESEEPGFLTKPYGGVASTQTSGDQLQSVTMGLDAYRRIACGEDAATIDAMFVGFADYQMRRQYAPKQGSYFALLFEPGDWISGSWGRALITSPCCSRPGGQQVTANSSKRSSASIAAARATTVVLPSPASGSRVAARGSTCPA